MLQKNLCKMATLKKIENWFSKRKNDFKKTNYRLMQVKRIAKCSKGDHSAILLTFIKLPFVINIFVLSILEWLFYTGFTVFMMTSALLVHYEITEEL